MCWNKHGWVTAGVYCIIASSCCFSKNILHCAQKMFRMMLCEKMECNSCVKQQILLCRLSWYGPVDVWWHIRDVLWNILNIFLIRDAHWQWVTCLQQSISLIWLQYCTVLHRLLASMSRSTIEYCWFCARCAVNEAQNVQMLDAQMFCAPQCCIIASYQ